MDQMLLTGLVSFRFSSLADSSPSQDSVAAPKLRFLPLCKGEPSDIFTSGAKASPIASLFASCANVNVSATAAAAHAPTRIPANPAKATLIGNFIRTDFVFVILVLLKESVPSISIETTLAARNRPVKAAPPCLLLLLLFARLVIRLSNGLGLGLLFFRRHLVRP